MMQKRCNIKKRKTVSKAPVFNVELQQPSEALQTDTEETSLREKIWSHLRMVLL